jgi:hypothetical protein
MKFHFWHTFLSLFYIAVATLAIWWLAATGRLANWIPISDFFLMALATQRLVRLTTYDNITAFIRGWFYGADPESFRGSLGMLINCPWCTGLWFALVVVFFYFATPYAWYAILILAISSMASLFQLVLNWLGWSAESKKREANQIALPR